MDNYFRLKEIYCYFIFIDSVLSKARMRLQRVNDPERCSDECSRSTSSRAEYDVFLRIHLAGQRNYSFIKKETGKGKQWLSKKNEKTLSHSPKLYIQ